jgi:Peptidase M15
MNVLQNLEKPYKLVNAPKEVVKAVQNQLIKVQLLDGVADGIAGKFTLAAFATFKELEYLEYPDLLGKSTAIALLEATSDRNAPTDEPNKAKDTSLKAFFPKVGWVGANQPVHAGGNFTWGEFTKNLIRVPQNEKVVDAIKSLAYYLQTMRSHFGQPSIIIVSGYRPPLVNSGVGGASNSQHLYGAAADIVVNGIRPHEVYSRLNQTHGSKGGLGNGSTFTHVDLRGYRARWAYGNA